jgi:hypothetical protein
MDHVRAILHWDRPLHVKHYVKNVIACYYVILGDSRLLNANGQVLVPGHAFVLLCY